MFCVLFFRFCPHLYCYNNNKDEEMISQVRSFIYLDKQGTPEEGWAIQRPKHCITNSNNKDEDNSPKNNTQNIALYQLF